MISFSDWNALLLYADELEEKLKNEHGINIIIRPYNTEMYEKGMQFSLLNKKGKPTGQHYYTEALHNVMDGKIIMAAMKQRIANEVLQG